MTLRAAIGAFWADRGGNVAIIVALVFVPMVVLAGGATDLARYETFRVALQDGVDRGVLAAAALNQTQASETTVRDYLGDLADMDGLELNVQDVVRTINAKKVTAVASFAMPTAFLPLVGIETLPIRAAATAEDRRSRVELSLILDFSGSMAGNKFSRLKVAAKEFVDTILAPDARETTTVSVVPYAGQVNVGAAMYDTLINRPQNPTLRLHNASSCFTMNTGSWFGTGTMPFIPSVQVPVFTRYNQTNYTTNLNPDWCPYERNAISYLSNDPTALKARIDGYQMHDGTGTHIAVNWGYMLLDPKKANIVQHAITLGLTKPQFSNRPAPFNDGETLKFIVLMTDGEINDQWTAKRVSTNPREADNYTQISNRATNLPRMYAVCDAAKANGVVVFTIGFEIGAGPAAEMRKCASSDSHYYNVSGLDISLAFRSIASAIQQIKLTQ